MADCHPNKLGFICQRVAHESDSKDLLIDDPETLENQTHIEYIGACSFKIKIFKENVNSLTSNSGAMIQDQRDCLTETKDAIEITMANENDDESKINGPEETSAVLKDSSINDIKSRIINEATQIDNF